MLFFCLVEDTRKKELADLLKDIEEKDKEILIYIELSSKGRRKGLSSRINWKKLEEEKEDWEKEKEAFKKRIYEMENAGFFAIYYFVIIIGTWWDQLILKI